MEKRARAREEGAATREALSERQEAGDDGEVTVEGYVGDVAADGGDGEEDDEAGDDDGDEGEVRCALVVSPGPLGVSILCPHRAANRDRRSFVWHRSHWLSHWGTESTRQTWPVAHRYLRPLGNRL